MKLFVSRKKYDLLNKEYLLLNDKHEELKDNYEAVNISNEINLNNINPTLVSCCVADCVYMGHCMEHKSCNYHKTFAFKEELEMYRENINQ